MCLSSSCTPVYVAPPSIPVNVVLPPRPVLEKCPEDPGVQGVVTEKRTVEIPVNDAIKLKAYIAGLIFCEKANVILLNSHIEKLENRIRALAGVNPN